jgi:hypothetical protein
MTPIQQIILSLRPKKKYSLMEFLPDFETYDNDIDINDDHTQSQIVPETYDNDIQGSLSEQIYRELDGTTTRNHFSFLFFCYIKSFFSSSGRSTKTTRKPSKPKVVTSNGQLIRYSMKLYLIIFIIHRILN